MYFLPLSFFLSTVAFLKPNLLKIPNYLWYRFVVMLSKITNPIILFIIFYLLFFPISMLIKILKVIY
jgi:hypothetical protein